MHSIGKFFQGSAQKTEEDSKALARLILNPYAQLHHVSRFDNIFNTKFTIEKLKDFAAKANIEALIIVLKLYKGIVFGENKEKKTQLSNILLQLLREKADVNAQTHGTTPFKFAFQQNLPTQILRLLVEHGADVNAVLDTESGETPIMTLMLQEGEDITKLIELMLKKGAKINQAFSPIGETAFTCAIDYGADAVQWLRQPLMRRPQDSGKLSLEKFFLLAQRRVAQAQTIPEIVELIYEYASRNSQEIRDNKALYVMPNTSINSVPW